MKFSDGPASDNGRICFDAAVLECKNDVNHEKTRYKVLTGIYFARTVSWWAADPFAVSACVR